MECHVCGKPASKEIILEGARVWVCGDCAKYGRVVSAPKKIIVKSDALPRQEIVLVQDFGKIVRNAREKTGFERKELAEKIFVREHELAKIEAGELAPEEKVARKLEHALGIKLFETVEAGKGKPEKKKAGGLTLGDVVELKKE
jgi:putative transcription factor